MREKRRRTNWNVSPVSSAGGDSLGFVLAAPARSINNLWALKFHLQSAVCALFASSRPTETEIETQSGTGRVACSEELPERRRSGNFCRLRGLVGALIATAGWLAGWPASPRAARGRRPADHRQARARIHPFINLSEVCARRPVV